MRDANRIGVLAFTLIVGTACARESTTHAPVASSVFAKPVPSAVQTEPAPTASQPAASAAPSASEPPPTPEQLAKGRKGSITCGTKGRCRAGREVCVSSLSPTATSHCERIVRWDRGRTPVPENAAPPMAGLTVCNGSHQCPEGSVCCLHEIGSAVVQATVCHAGLNECRDRRELCDGDAKDGCRSPGTRCDEWKSVRTPLSPSPRAIGRVAGAACLGG